MLSSQHLLMLFGISSALAIQLAEEMSHADGPVSVNVTRVNDASMTGMSCKVLKCSNNYILCEDRFSWNCVCCKPPQVCLNSDRDPQYVACGWPTVR